MNDYTIINNKNQIENSTLDKCKEKKLKNSKFTNYIKLFISEKMRLRVFECGSFLEFLGDFEMENKKLNQGNFCKNRFCPMCSWRKSCKDSLKISILMEHLRLEYNKEFIFLTLTTPNVKGDKLKEEIDKYNKSFKKLMELKEVKSITKGYIRKLEVTYNSDSNSKSYDTYHPHFHVIIAVNKNYFTQTKQYINRDRWLELWQKSTNDYSITQVDVRKAKNGDLKAIYELAKYSAKDNDYLHSRSVFKVFYEALKKRQLIVYGGLFKEAAKMYESGELDIYKKKSDIEYVYKLYYNWHKTEYINSNIIELTVEEKERINKKLIDDIDI